MTISAEQVVALDDALRTLRNEPRELSELLGLISRNIGTTPPSLTDIVTHISDCGPNDPVKISLTLKLHSWDHEESPTWSKGTKAHSAERRALVLAALGFDQQEVEAINHAIPIFNESQVAIVIAEAHDAWYELKRSGIRPFYWDHYVSQLAGRWHPDAIARLGDSTDDVISRLSDPTRSELYQAKGLVMGYVQSGKTSHFSGLIAKAADAGYRLVIVLAGLTDILRQQTQRRIDKEIIGQELLGLEEYGGDPDWLTFVSHGGRPSTLGYFDWQRLTRSEEDYRSLHHLLALLEFKPADHSRPFNDVLNLRSAVAKVAVIKKRPSRIRKLCDDLENLRQLRTTLETRTNTNY